MLGPVEGEVTMQPTWPGHLMDLDEWNALPGDPERRYELALGVTLDLAALDLAALDR